MPGFRATCARAALAGAALPVMQASLGYMTQISHPVIQAAQRVSLQREGFGRHGFKKLRDGELRAESFRGMARHAMTWLSCSPFCSFCTRPKTLRVFVARFRASNQGATAYVMTVEVLSVLQSLSSVSFARHTSTLCNSVYSVMAESWISRRFESGRAGDMHIELSKSCVPPCCTFAHTRKRHCRSSDPARAWRLGCVLAQNLRLLR